MHPINASVGETKADDLQKLRDSFSKIEDDLENWMEKATLMEIRLAKLKKNNLDYHLLDPEFYHLIKTIENLKQDKYDFANEEQENNEAMGVLGDSRIEEKTEPSFETMASH